MVLSRLAQKCERVTVTLIPTSDERSFRHIPTTFSPTERVYSWRHYQRLEYMIVPQKISRKEIKVDLYVGAQAKGRVTQAEMQKMVQNFVSSKIDTEWAGLKLAGIRRAAAAVPPAHAIRRGTIEEMLGAGVESA